MISYQTESFSKCLEEMKSLFIEHYNEIGNKPDKIKLDPDYDIYQKLEELNLIHLVTVRKDGNIVGYYLSVLSPLLHFKQILNAHNDAIYVQKEHRKGSIGYRLIKYAFEDLKTIGVNMVTIHTKVKQPFDKLCLKLGMTLVERNYIKYLE